jgi:hypothetical protein
MTTITLRGGHPTSDRRLDRIPSATDEHIQKYPLTMFTLPASDASMVIGVNWYSNFDNPVQRKIHGRNKWVIGEGDLGAMRGGHSTCLRNWNIVDRIAWWDYYNQGVEGRCVEFASLRERSHANHRRYDITSRWHYFAAQQKDEWEGGSYPGASPSYEGTSVRAMMEVLRDRGPVLARPRGIVVPSDMAELRIRPEDGISTYRWATSWDDVRTVLKVPAWMPGVPLLNSWGRDYPHEVILLDGAGARLLAEDGEFSVVTDK